VWENFQIEAFFKTWNRMQRNLFCHLKTYPTDYFIFEKHAEQRKYRALNYLWILNGINSARLNFFLFHSSTFFLGFSCLRKHSEMRIFLIWCFVVVFTPHLTQQRNKKEKKNFSSFFFSLIVGKSTKRKTTSRISQNGKSD
jgi:hypothetical protein